MLIFPLGSLGIGLCILRAKLEVPRLAGFRQNRGEGGKEEEPVALTVALVMGAERT